MVVFARDVAVVAKRPYMMNMQHPLSRATGAALVAVTGQRQLPLLLPVGTIIIRAQQNPGVIQFLSQRLAENQPVAIRLQCDFWQIDLAKAKRFVGVPLDFAVAGRLCDYRHLAPGPPYATHVRFGLGTQGADMAADAGAGVIINHDGAHVGDTAVPIQLLHQKSSRLVHVDSPLVEQKGHAFQVHLANDAHRRLPGRVYLVDQHRIVAAGPQRDLAGGRAFAHVVVLLACLVQQAGFFQRVEKFIDFTQRAVWLTAAERNLKGGALQMFDHDPQVVGIDQGVFRRLAKQVAGMVADVLIERVVAGDEDGHRLARAASGAARLLPGSGNRAGIAGQHGRIQLADVDAQLQGVGSHHAPYAAGP